MDHLSQQRCLPRHRCARAGALRCLHRELALGRVVLRAADGEAEGGRKIGLLEELPWKKQLEDSWKTLEETES